MNIQDYMALSFVFLIAGSIFYKKFFAKNKLSSCGSCKGCATNETQTTSIKFSV